VNTITLLIFASLQMAPAPECDAIAERTMRSEFQDENAVLLSHELYTDVQGVPSVHGYVYELSNSACLDANREYDANDDEWGVDRYVTVYVSAAYDKPPVMEIAQCLPAWVVNKQKAVQKSMELWPSLHPSLAGYIYLAPLDEWFRFSTDEGYKYLHSRELREYDLSALKPATSSEFLSTINDPGWQGAESGAYLAEKKKKIEGVPFALWSYGCSPTASSMILDYWDRHGYPKLVDFYFDRYDQVEKEDDHDLTNVHRELAIAMRTDSAGTGGTSAGAINGGNIQVTNSVNSYSFSGRMVSGSNVTVYSTVIDEIDNGRPVHWSVGAYEYNGKKIYHSITGVGYEITSSNDSFVIIHNTWDKGEHKWLYRTPGSYSEAYPLIPGGEQDENLRLTSFTNKFYTSYKGLTYALCWDAQNISNVKIWKIKGTDKNDWDLLTEVSDKNYYPLVANDNITGARICIEGYKGASLVAADGTPAVIAPKVFPAKAHFTPKAHLPVPSFSAKKVLIGNNKLGALKLGGRGGVKIIELIDDMVFPRYSVSLRNVDDIALDANWLYVLASDTVSLFDISSPDSLKLVKQIALSGSYSSIAAYGGCAYVGSAGSQLTVLKQDSEGILKEVSSLPESSVKGIKAIAKNLYLSSSDKTVKIYSLSDPENPLLIKTVSTKAVPNDVTVSGSTIYVAEGYSGVEVINLNTGETHTISEGNALQLEATGNRLYWVGGQSGFFVYEIAKTGNLTKLGSLQMPYGQVNGLAISGNRLCMGCGFDGFFVFESDLSGIKESPVLDDDFCISELNIAEIAHSGVSMGAFTVSSAGAVETRLFDVTGRQLLHISQKVQAGKNELPAVPSELSSGVYFVKIAANGKVSSGKILVVK